MPEEVTISDDGKFIHVRSYGEVTDEDFRSSLDAIHKIRQDQGLTKVLVDATEVSSYPSGTLIFCFGASAAELLKEAGMSLAIVAPPEATEEPEFFQHITTSRGLSTKVFDTLDAALPWLNSEPPPWGRPV